VTAQRELFPPDRGLQARMVLALLFDAVLLAAAAAGIGYLAATSSMVRALLSFVALFAFMGFVASAAASQSRRRQADTADPVDVGRVTAIAGRLSLHADLPAPDVSVLPEPAPLSWTTAPMFRRPRLWATTALLERLDDAQLEAVVAHELAHLANRDARVMTVLGGPPALLLGGLRHGLKSPKAWASTVLFGLWLSPVLGVLSASARLVSRHRELAADRGAAVLCGSPATLAAALIALSEGLADVPKKDLRVVASADVFHVLPARRTEATGIARLWATHPPLRARLEQLDELEAGLQR
jgi:heat shock protein HtpX